MEDQVLTKLLPTYSLYLGMKAESVIPVKARRLPPKLTHLGISMVHNGSKETKTRNTKRQIDNSNHPQRRNTETNNQPAVQPLT